MMDTLAPHSCSQHITHISLIHNTLYYGRQRGLIKAGRLPCSTTRLQCAIALCPAWVCGWRFCVCPTAHMQPFAPPASTPLPAWQASLSIIPRLQKLKELSTRNNVGEREGRLTPQMAWLVVLPPGGATTTGPDATPPPAICQNLGGGPAGGRGGGGGGSSRGSGGGGQAGGRGGSPTGGRGGGLAGGQGGVQPGVRGGGDLGYG